MRKALCVLSVLAIVAVASAEIDVRIWLTTQNPASIITFAPTFGPFTPFTTGSNGNGSYDVHRNNVSTTNPGDVNTPKFALSSVKVEEPTGLAPGTPVYIWAAFAGVGDEPGLAPGLGWADPGTKITGMHLDLVPTAGLTLNEHWYQYASATSSRWESTSDLSGDGVTMVGINAWAFNNGATALDRMQNNADSASTAFSTAAILLGAIQPSGAGSVKIGLGFNGIASNVAGTVVQYLPGTETAAIAAGVVSETTPPRVGTTPQATWVPEPASALLIALGALVLRRR